MPALWIKPLTKPNLWQTEVTERRDKSLQHLASFVPHEVTPASVVLNPVILQRRHHNLTPRTARKTADCIRVFTVDDLQSAFSCCCSIFWNNHPPMLLNSSCPHSFNKRDAISLFRFKMHSLNINCILIQSLGCKRVNSHISCVASCCCCFSGDFFKSSSH